MRPGTAPTTQAGTARRSRIPPMAYGVLVVAVFFGGIGIAYAGGAWQTTGRPVGDGRPALQGQAVTEVKGWMAVGDVADAFGVPLEALLVAFDLPADTSPATALKDLESDRFTVMALREWLAEAGPSSP